MKKILVLVCMAVIILPMAINIYAQPLEAPNIASGSLIAPLQRSEKVTIFSSSFLKDINPKEDAYTDTPIDKMGMGAINTATSWADIPKQVSEVSQQENIFLGLTMGFGQGLVVGLARGMSGIVDMTTCGLPPYDETLMKPEYKVQQPEKEFKVALFQW